MPGLLALAFTVFALPALHRARHPCPLQHTRVEIWLYEQVNTRLEGFVQVRTTGRGPARR